MEEGNEKNPIDVRNSVMGKIKTRKIKMRSHLVFLAEKLGLESALIISLLAGAILISIFFYFFKKTGLLKFLSLGIPGFQVFLYTLPYDYVALFLIAILLAVYFAKKLDLPCKENMSCDRMSVLFITLSILVGLFFILIGLHETLRGWSSNKVPRDMAVFGKIKKVEGKSVWIEDEDGNLVKVIIDGEKKLDEDFDKIEGKIFRAIGDRDEKSENPYFHAKNFVCCDNN